MTLPFRRRHNDAEASHDRARSIIAMGFVEPTDAADDAWLEAHLEGCADCRADLNAYAEDRELLRELRATLPEPPRDLWARTAASIERDGAHRGRDASRLERTGRHERQAGRTGRGGPRVLRLPIGVLSGVLVVLVVVATSFFPRDGALPLGSLPPEASDVAGGSTVPGATPLAVTARALSWVEERSDGTFQLVFADLNEVCVSEPEACAPIDEAGTTRLALEAEPESMLLAPDSHQLVVVTKATPSGGSGGEVIIVPVMTPAPSSDPGTSPSATPETTGVPTTPPTPPPTPTLGPDETPGPPSLPPPTMRPDGSLAILSGVVVVGEAAYSEDGQWLAFSARPVDGSSGPDLYIWHVGIDPAASAVTFDHRTFFAGWLGNRILASRVETAVPEEPTESPDPPAGATVAPTATPAPTRTPAAAKSPKPSRTPSPGNAGQSGTPEPSPEASPAVLEDHPVSFLLDPATSPATITDLAGDDIWRPVVDPASRTIVYWSGTLVPDATGTGWDLGTGQLVIDGWFDPAAAPAASPDPGASPSGAAPITPAATTAPPATPTPPPSVDPLASPAPTPSPGPAGAPVVLAEGRVVDFDVRYDPTGTRLAVWVRDPENPDVGTLRLFVIDVVTGHVDPNLDPLPAAPALRGFSIGEGRMAWVTPPGQDGESSHVQVLAWTDNEFGQVRSIAADRMFVVR